MDIRDVFFLFLIYSFLGWLMEVIVVSINNKKLMARGFLIGPLCPIYGTGALLITFALANYFHDPFILFVMSTIFGGILEYFTNYIMEKIFKTRWWDYSHKKLNLNGRISLDSSIAFGFLGVITVYILNPFFINILHMIPNIVMTILTIALLILLIIDCIISFKVVSSIKKIDISGARDATEEITARVKLMLKNNTFLKRRLLAAFPNFKVMISKTSEKITRKIKK